MPTLVLLNHHDGTVYKHYLDDYEIEMDDDDLVRAFCWKNNIDTHNYSYLIIDWEDLIEI